MQNFTPVSALIGGSLIGLSTVLLLWLNGRIAGISGICRVRNWRVNVYPLRFQSLPHQTQLADLPHYAFLITSC